jgi:glycopeptide antibiotics resistance protein
LKQAVNRNRLGYFIACCVVIALGLGARKYAALLPKFVADYAGDTLWALMVSVGIGFLAPRWSSLRVALAALLFSFSVELSQLYHAPWIDGLRRMGIGGLILGYGFLWSDLLCYSVGVALGWLIEGVFIKLGVRMENR